MAAEGRQGGLLRILWMAVVDGGGPLREVPAWSAWASAAVLRFAQMRSTGVSGPMAAQGNAAPHSSSVALTLRERSLCHGINPWLAPLAMWLTQDVALSGFFFGGVRVLGAEHLPRRGPVLLAPTHRSRWDALMLPRAAGPASTPISPGTT